MISGKTFDNSEIRDLEAKYLWNFYHADNPDPILSDGIRYYLVLFNAYMELNKDRVFAQLDQKEQNNILDNQRQMFAQAMQYSFNKGHQAAFAWLLSNSRVSQKLDESFFSNPNSKLAFVYNVDHMIKPKVQEENLRRDRNEILIREIRRHFEHGYPKIMEFAKIFYRKGFAVAFEDVRKNIVKVDYQIKGTSRLLNIPYNQDIDVTPAFSATFAFESSSFEEWDLHWNATYGYDVNKKIIGKFIIHQLTKREIDAFSEVGAIDYKMVQSRISTNLKPDDIIYLGEINWNLVRPIAGMPVIYPDEYNAIREQLAMTLQRSAHINANQILVTI